MDNRPVTWSHDGALDDAPAPAVSFEVDANGVIINVSPACEALLGWTSQDLIDTPLTRVIPERFHDAHRAGFRRFLDTGEMALEGQPTRVPAIHALGREIDVELELRRATGGNGVVAIGTLRPIEEKPSPSNAHLSGVVRDAVAAELPLAELVHRCLAAAATQHGWTVAAVWWIDPWMDRLRAIAIWEAEPGSHPRYLAETAQTVFAKNEGLVGETWSTGLPTFHDDLETEAKMLRDVAIAQDGLHGGLFFPLIASGETVGVVEMLDSKRRHFSIDDQESVWVLADELGRMVADRLRREHEAVQRKRIRTALTAGSMGVWSYHIETHTVTWDEQLEELHGLAPGSFEGTLTSFADRIHPDDRDKTLTKLLDAAQEGQRFDHRFRSTRTDGSVLWLQSAATPVTDAEGQLRALTGVSFDITDRVRSEELLDKQARHAALAADVGRALVSRDDLQHRLQAVVEAVVERIDAAFARVWTVAPGDDVLELQASAGLYTHLDGQHSMIPIGHLKIGTIAASRTPHLTNDVPNDDLVSHPNWAKREGMVAFAGYPLIVGDQLVGVLALFSRRALPKSTLAALASISDTTAIAILQSWAFKEMEVLTEQARRTAREMEVAMLDRAQVASVLQSSLLPPSLPTVPGWEIDAKYSPGIEVVGGDFYDVFPLHNGWAFMIGDVCGRGPLAARFTALARHTLRTALLLGHGPAGALAALNDSLLSAENDFRFCTVVCGVIDGQTNEPTQPDTTTITARLSIGGHPLPLIVRADGKVEPAGLPGSLLGILAEPTHHECVVALGPGDNLVLYTDGVTEARRGSEQFGEERLRSLLSSVETRTPTSLVSAITEQVSQFSPEASDDLAVLVLGRPR